MILLSCMLCSFILGNGELYCVDIKSGGASESEDSSSRVWLNRMWNFFFLDILSLLTSEQVEAFFFLACNIYFLGSAVLFRSWNKCLTTKCTYFWISVCLDREVKFPYLLALSFEVAICGPLNFYMASKRNIFWKW